MEVVGWPSAWLVILALHGVGSARAAAPAGEATRVEPGEAIAPATEPTAPEEPTAEIQPQIETAPETEEMPAEPQPPAGAASEQAPASERAPAREQAPASEQAPAREQAPTPAQRPRTYPRLVLAGGPIVGPHAIGNEQCDVELARCETKGSFLGLGAQLELRARLWRLIYAHARGLAVGNVSPNDRIHRGLWGVGAGLGLYSRRVFGRAEYLFVDTFGDNHFEPPFYQGEVAYDEWGHHAGMLSVGFRQPLPRGVAAELWGGLVIGPHSRRQVPQEQPDDRVLTTFLVGLNVSWDVLP
jgi:hypothetical protein